ncbi:type II toxin-antitoxin system death-on-curing family toxin [Meiothermus cerbereus]|uniref:type II toxin-antitoxin system death-on-curing family toxin n=1 Tax=Meiothermus cerbereus TaxID=65552 RepID=UPI003EEBE0D8
MALPSASFFYRYKGHRYPTGKLIATLHLNALVRFGGLEGVRDVRALQSALHAPISSAGGQDAYPTFFTKVAALGFQLVKNHAFNDANKRTAWLAVETTLHANGYYTSRPAIEIEDIMVLMAAGYLSLEGFRAFLLMACNQDYTDPRL